MLFFVRLYVFGHGSSVDMLFCKCCSVNLARVDMEWGWICNVVDVYKGLIWNGCFCRLISVLVVARLHVFGYCYSAEILLC